MYQIANDNKQLINKLGNTRLAGGKEFGYNLHGVASQCQARLLGVRPEA